MAQVLTNPDYTRFDELFKHFARTNRRGLSLTLLTIHNDVWRISSEISRIRQWTTNLFLNLDKIKDTGYIFEYYKEKVPLLTDFSVTFSTHINEIMSVLTNEEHIKYSNDVNKLQKIVDDINSDIIDITMEIYTAQQRFKN